MLSLDTTTPLQPRRLVEAAHDDVPAERKAVDPDDAQVRRHGSEREQLRRGPDEPRDGARPRKHRKTPSYALGQAQALKQRHPHEIHEVLRRQPNGQVQERLRQQAPPVAVDVLIHPILELANPDRITRRIF